MLGSFFSIEGVFLFINRELVVREEFLNNIIWIL